MFLSKASTRRPIAMTCLLLALIGMGLNAYRKMSIENIPAIDIPYVVVVTTWAGASPEDIEKNVSKHIEDAVSGIDGLKHIESSSLENVSQVVLEFQLSVDVDTAAQDVREKVDGILSELPAGTDRPVIQKININATSVANIFLTGDLPLDDLYDYADNTIADRFATVPGVGEVQVIGGNEREVWVELDREKLVAAGLTSYDVAAALQAGVLSIPGGNLRERGDEFSVRFDAEYDAFADIANLQVASRDGVRRTVGDLGSVRMATEEVRQRAVLDGRPGVLLKVVKKAEGNVVRLVSEIRKRFDQIQSDLPGGMELVWVNDEAAFITSSFNDTLVSIGQAILICAGILLFFLVNIRTTVVVAVAMPVTILISVFFMQLAGMTFNMVTLLAIGLSTGVLVSNSIVVLENIVSKLETVPDRWRAADEGASEVAVAVLASAGTNVVVMFPIAMMTSMAGKMLSPFAVTTLIVNAVSIFVSFTLTPILCALLLRPAAERPHNVFTRAAGRWLAGFERVGAFYARRILRPVAASRFVSIPLVAGFVVLVVFTFKVAGGQLGFNMMETPDMGRIFIRVEAPSSSNLDATYTRLQALAARVADFIPDVSHILLAAGKADSISGQANEGVYMGQIEVFCPPKTERDWSVSELLPRLRAHLADEPDLLISASEPSMMGGQSFNIEQNFSGDDLDTLDTLGTSIQAACRDLPGISFLDTTVRDTKPEVRVVPKRTVLSDLHLPAATLGNIVRANVNGIEAASWKSGDRSYDIRVKLAETPGKDQIRQFLLPGAEGRPIPLESVADVLDARVRTQVYRVDKRRTVKILGATAPGASMSVVAAEMDKAIADNHLLPPGYEQSASGMAEMLGEVVADFLEAILLAIFLTLLTLAAILESWSRPALVLLTIPMALVGVLWALVAFGYNISIMVLLGMLMLIGIVVNAAILIVDQTARNMADGMTRRQSMLRAVDQQFRPVVMVVLASALGMLPLALSQGIGSENRVGIGTASVFGILVAGALTLVLIPVLWVLFTRKPARDRISPA